MPYSANLRKVLSENEMTVCPGVHDPLTARVADRLDFDVIYMTGYGSSLSVTGFPDAGVMTMPEIIENAKNIQETVNRPLIADADTGYGNVTNTIRTVREYIRAGIGGIHIEDQAFPKRCGTVSGKEYIDLDQAVAKIQAATDVRDERDEDFVIIGRSDVEDTDEAIKRVNAYADAGADLVFPSGVKTIEDIEKVGNQVAAPLMYTNAAIGEKPVLAPHRLSELGFDMVVYWDISMLSTVISTHKALQQIESNDISILHELSAELDSLAVDDFHEFAGFPEIHGWEEQYSGN